MPYENKMARNFLWAVVFIVTLMIVFASLFFSYRMPLTFWFLTPDKTISEIGTPEAPQYDTVDGWWILAGSSNNIEASPSDYDVFYIHPTTYFNPASWNAPLNDENANTFLTNTVLPQQLSPFADHARAFAPKYRQVTIAALRNDSISAEEAVKIAREDVFAAFEEYKNNWNDGRPFIIAAHSQGSFHALHLLHKIKENETLTHNLIAAYLPGWPVTHPDLEALGTISTCEKRMQTNCIASWNSFMEGSNPTDWLSHYYLWGTLTPSEPFTLPILCTNPISWTESKELISSGPSNGISFFDEKGEFATDNLPLSLSCGTEGVLYLTPFSHPSLFTNLLPDGNLHLYDYALFARSIEINARERAEAWLKNKENSQ